MHANGKIETTGNGLTFYTDPNNLDNSVTVLFKDGHIPNSTEHYGLRVRVQLFFMLKKSQDDPGTGIYLPLPTEQSGVKVKVYASPTNSATSYIEAKDLGDGTFAFAPDLAAYTPIIVRAEIYPPFVRYKKFDQTDAMSFILPASYTIGSSYWKAGSLTPDQITFSLMVPEQLPLVNGRPLDDTCTKIRQIVAFYRELFNRGYFEGQDVKEMCARCGVEIN